MKPDFIKEVLPDLIAEMGEESFAAVGEPIEGMAPVELDVAKMTPPEFTIFKLKVPNVNCGDTLTDLGWNVGDLVRVVKESSVGQPFKLGSILQIEESQLETTSPSCKLIKGECMSDFKCGNTWLEHTSNLEKVA